MGDRNLLWAPDAIVPVIQHLPLAEPNRKQRTDVFTGSTTRADDYAATPNPEPNPERDAARMAALKRLRHRMISLCSANSSSLTGRDKQSGNKTTKIKPPTLAFERWLARAALRQLENTGADPIIPSDGILDEGLVKDLARSFPSHAAAQSVADEMARHGQKAAQGVAKVGREERTHALLSVNEARGKIKEGARLVSDAAKVARKVLKQNGVDSDDNHGKGTTTTPEAIQKALASLRAATAGLDVVAREVERATGCSSSSASQEDDWKVSLDQSRRWGIFDVTLEGPDGKPKRPYLTVSSSHLSKLLHLWSLQKSENRDGGKTEVLPAASEFNHPGDVLEALPDDERTRFGKTLYCCLARYEGLKGAGYQCAVPGIAFDAAAEECGLGTTIECFASPLNCRYRTYCSAFPDVESSFGSMGSFFDDKAFNPVEGSFQANPPFVPETMLAMGRKMERLLGDEDHRRGALSFLVVIPAWGTGIKFCRDLETSRHCRATARIPAAEHAFADGTQHTKPSWRMANSDKTGALLRPSSWDTAVILMQNDEGAAQWPVDTKKLEGSFCKALREAAGDIPEEMGTLDAWEKRGVARGGSLSSKRQKRNRQIGSS